MAPRSGAREDDFLANVKIGVVPSPGPSARRRDYTPNGPKDIRLTEMVWESYTSGKTMVVACPPGKEEAVFGELWKARSFLKHVHRNDEPPVDIRGMDRPNFRIVNPDEITDTKLRTAYRKVIPIGWVGVEFQARPALNRGMRALKAKQRAAASGSTSKSARAKGTRDEIKNHDSGMRVPFSG